MCPALSLPVERDCIVTNDLTELRAKAPLVHCITNYVAMNIAANTLLAAVDAVRSRPMSAVALTT